MTTSTPATSPSMRGPAWHTLSSEDALHEQSVDAATGLSEAEAERRLKQFGPNKFAEAKKELPTEPVKLGKRQSPNGYKEPGRAYHLVPEVY